MVDELRKLTKGKLPFWLEKELEKEAQSSGGRKKMAKKVADDSDMASFAEKALASAD